MFIAGHGKKANMAASSQITQKQYNYYNEVVWVWDVDVHMCCTLENKQTIICSS